jgi:hypothetical protein
MTRDTILMVGGPFDGAQVPNPGGYFKEGDYEAVDACDIDHPQEGWTVEYVYQVRGGRLVYDPDATARRRAVTVAEQN